MTQRMIAYRRLAMSALALLCAGLFAVGPARGQTTLLGFDDAKPDWKYLDDGSEPGASWSGAKFDDAKWRSGAAPLGYGESDVRAKLDFGADREHKPITAYFRRAISIAAPDEVKQLVMYLRCDDGAVVYLNGREGARFNLPAGQLSAGTLASKPLEALDERVYRRFVLPASLLVKGNNSLAVEVHQSGPASDDLCLDVVLKSFAKDDPLRPKLANGSEAVVRRFRQEHYVGPGLTIPDGYADGGRGMRIGGEGELNSGRELIVVDRKHDAALEAHLRFARSAELKAKPALERATEIAKYVDREMNGSLGRHAAADATGELASQHGDEGVLLGEVPKLCGAGACRHRSLLYKLMADEAGLDVALVRGNLVSGGFGGGHAWNELKLEDGKVLLVDTMNPLPNFRFPDVHDPLAKSYWTVGGKPYYGQKK